MRAYGQVWGECHGLLDLPMITRLPVGLCPLFNLSVWLGHSPVSHWACDHMVTDLPAKSLYIPPDVTGSDVTTPLMQFPTLIPPRSHIKTAPYLDLSQSLGRR